MCAWGRRAGGDAGYRCGWLSGEGMRMIKSVVRLMLHIYGQNDVR